MFSTQNLVLSLPPAAFWGAATIFLCISYAVFTREATRLRSIPGPFLASISKLWLVQQQLGSRRPLVDQALHKKYGPIVRVSPKEVIVSSPASKRIIYGRFPAFLIHLNWSPTTGATSKFRKGDWYIATSECGWSGPDELDFLSEQNMEKYRIQRRLVGPAYTAAYMKELEGSLDEVLEKNINIMHKRAGQSVDIDHYFNLFTSGGYIAEIDSTFTNLL